jgi:hypothetical protein
VQTSARPSLCDRDHAFRGYHHQRGTVRTGYGDGFLRCQEYRQGDKAVCDFLSGLPDHKTVILDVIPTAENLAQTAFDILGTAYQDTFGNHLRLERVRLYETPNNWADCVRS